VAEWSIAPVLKTGGSKGPVSSNLTASAKYLGFSPLFFCNLDFEARDSDFGVLPHPFACLTE